MAEIANSHPHLELGREEPVTGRRPPEGFPPAREMDDPRSHGAHLGERLQKAREAAAADLGGYDERRLIKIQLAQKVSPEGIERAAGVEVVSQEDGTLVLAFATEEQLDDFEAKLANLAAGEHVTYANLVYALQDLDHWTSEDRSGWALRRDGFPDGETFVIDAELWPLARGNDAIRLRDAFSGWVEENGGEILDSVQQPYLTIYRIRCDLGFAQDLLRHRDVRTADLPPRIGLERELVLADVQQLDEVPSPPEDAPGIVVLDTGLAAGHPVLGPAVGDAQSFLSGASAADEHGHGTFVSGIALYGEVADSLRSGRFVSNLRLFSGRVLNERNEGDSDLIHNQIERAVRYFAEHYGCRVFNLSYGDENKPYQGRHVSGLAATLDSLSRELDVLFVVPTGNYDGEEHGPNNWLAEYPDYLTGPSSVLLDPAPALNALTVGSLARHERNERWPSDPAYRPVARSDQPSPFTRHGPSVSGAIKPDLVDYGGNMMIDGRAGGNPMRGQLGAGELSTSSNFATGRPFAEDSGTSYAAPRVANAAANILAELPSASVDLCRALLVAHARTPIACADLFAGNDDALRDVTGYGLVDRSALYRSFEDCVTLWAEESLQDRHHHFYEIPVPAEFWHGDNRPREITVALAYRPPIRTTRVDYRAVSISFKFVQANSLEEVVRRFNVDVDKDTTTEIQERPSSRRFSETVRSRGTVQGSTWTFTQPSAALSNTSLYVVVTRNDPAWGEALSSEREPYTMVVKLDDRLAQLQLQLTPRLYTRVQERLRARARVTG